MIKHPVTGFFSGCRVLCFISLFQSLGLRLNQMILPFYIGYRCLRYGPEGREQRSNTGSKRRELRDRHTDNRLVPNVGPGFKKNAISDFAQIVIAAILLLQVLWVV